MGLKFAISSDAHSTQQLSYLQFGVYQARRGWLEASDIINTLPLNKLMKLLNRS
jgi:DNA polymerase (family 10)